MGPSDERVIVLAPSAHDGPVTGGILSKAGFECVLVRDVAELCRAVEDGAAVALVAQEALGPSTTARPFAELLDAQEPWSDLPVVIFTARGVPLGAPIVSLVGSGNVTLLERPVHTITLVSAVRSALRARRRQYAARAVLIELQTVLDAVPVAVWIARDARGDRIDANRFGADLLRARPGSNVSVTAPAQGGPRHFTARRQDRVLEGDDLPVQHAARFGAEVRDAEFDLVFDDGEVRHLLGNAAPLRNALGAVKGSVGAFIDITERRRAQDALRETEERFRIMADETPLLIWVTDPAGRLQFANRAYCEFFGLPIERIRDQGGLGMVHPEDAPAYASAFAEALARRAPFHSQARVRRADGQWRWVESSGTPRFSAAGEFLGHAGSSPDITDRVAAEQVIREADRRKSEFLAILSHELRNPLASISNALLLLEKAPRDGAVAGRASEILHRQTRQLSRLVDDLLDISRIAYGKIQLVLERLDAREIVRRAHADAKDLFDERGVELLVSEPAEPLWVEADAARFVQMLGNLLGNALKFTPAGGRVELTAARRGGACEVSVRDSGMGIEPAELERIFEPFAQVERTRRGQGGMGLGLALVRELASKQGGSVRVRSDGPGTGAEFVVQLPLTTRQPSVAEPVARGKQGRGLSILIVEDNEDGAATLADLVSLLGHSARWVGTGQAAIGEAGRAAPDALICDIGLPDMSGHEVIRAIRSSSEGRAVFAIALTGYAQPRDREEALAAGFDAHLAKPPQVEALEQLLAEAARRRGSRSMEASAAGHPGG